MMSVDFFVLGRPVPQGSMRAILSKTTHQIIMPTPPKLKAWRRTIAKAARPCFDIPFNAPVSLRCTFYLKPPQALPSWRRWPDKMPDLDKLVRAVDDALTGIAFDDDKRVVLIEARKIWGVREGVEISVRPLEQAEPQQVPLGV